MNSTLSTKQTFNSSARQAWQTRALGPLPALAAIAYPFLLEAFHALVGAPGSDVPTPTALAAGGIFAGMLAVPAIGIGFASRRRASSSARRLAYACVVAPTMYVLLGVVQAIAGSSLPDQAVWTAFWSGAALWTWFGSTETSESIHAPRVGKWRVAHGITGAIVLLYVLFHVANHLFGLAGPEAHAEVMDLGRKVYRAPLIELLLVALMLFQVGSGLYLAWKWSETSLDLQKTFQLATGFYLSVFILGHMNSVFIYARSFLGIPTDWDFATGAPSGLIHDPWNIRLVPHYLLGVFFVLAHLSSGLRGVMTAHGIDQRKVDAVWIFSTAASAVVAIAVILGMCGYRV